MPVPSHSPVVGVPLATETQRLKDVSVTERAGFRTCRRRWSLEVLDNLESKEPSWALAFGTGMHSALEAFYLRQVYGEGTPLEDAQSALTDWGKQQEANLRKEFTSDFLEIALQGLLEHENLGAAMLSNYALFDQEKQASDPWEIVAVEGRGLIDCAKGCSIRDGRMRVPIINPKTGRRVTWSPYLTAKIDLLVRRSGALRGLWVVDHKNLAQASDDRGLDFDDQVTGYCYVVWRVTGEIPRGVIYNVLIKRAPKAPRVLKNGDFSQDIQQLTTYSLYREALREKGIKDLKPYEKILNALSAKGWDPFFRRHEAQRSEAELLAFEERLVEEWRDMRSVFLKPGKAYPNLSTWWCPSCPVNKICAAMEDGSDVLGAIEAGYQQAEDRKVKA
jgi:hypothetical protein